MNSKFLIERGFQKFGEFDCAEIQKRKLELDFTGVYVFVLDSDFPRLCGTTDIIYIGHAGKRTERPIYKRMIDYCKAYESAPQDKRISEQIQQVKTKIRIGLALRDEVLNNRVTIFYKQIAPDQCREEESHLLKLYSEDHIELPPLNRSN